MAASRAAANENGLPADLHANDRDAHRSRLFAVEVCRKRLLSPSFLCLTFRGPDLGRYADNGFDEHVKILPGSPLDLPAAPVGPRWYQAWRTLPGVRTRTMRTYTTWRVRHDAKEVDIIFVLHEHGQVANWAEGAILGDQAVLIGPDAMSSQSARGIKFEPTKLSTSYLMIGDETAAPAIVRILGGLPPTATGAAFIEVPEARDRLDYEAPPGVGVVWLARTASQVYGEALVNRVAGWLRDERRMTTGHRGPLDPASNDVHPPSDSPYVWIAGEASFAASLRRSLLADGVPSNSVQFSGYWRRGARGA